MYKVREHIKKNVPVSDLCFLRVKISMITFGEDEAVAQTVSTTDFNFRDWYSGNKLTPIDPEMRGIQVLIQAT